MRAWVVTANMGYGHQRAVYPLKNIAEDAIFTVGENESTSKKEELLWRRVLGAYEFMSRAKSIPVVGNSFFNLLDTFVKIPAFYPIRDLSNSTFQVDLLRSNIEKGLCDDKEFPYLTQTTLQTRLREKHKIFVMVQIDKTMEPKFTYKIERYVIRNQFNDWNSVIKSPWLYYNYEEALEDGLIEAVSLITLQDLRKEKLINIRNGSKI